MKLGSNMSIVRTVTLLHFEVHAVVYFRLTRMFNIDNN